MIDTTELRARFARGLSRMYGQEVPAYQTLVEACTEINNECAAVRGDTTRLGSIERVTAERHGAIRVGTPQELRQVSRIFGALGMRPVGFYDLRTAATSAVPVVSTAFRPVDAEELERNPFRVFTSMLTVDDRRFFDADLHRRLENFLSQRTLFPPELLALSEEAIARGGLPDAQAEEFLRLAIAAFELSPQPTDRAWYRELERISAVAADIGGVAKTHINHLTPRVLDIDELYRRMTERGLTMIDKIQGPPRWDGPDVLLRQTSFRALAEPRVFREADGSITTGTLRVRFGEVEARGIALTTAGRALYDELIVAADAEHGPARTWQDAANRVWTKRFPDSEAALAEAGLAHFTYSAAPTRPQGATAPTGVRELLAQGWITAEPIVYEDFLPRSAAGIFQSNLSDEGSRNDDVAGTHYDRGWLSEVIGSPVDEPEELYRRQSEASLARVRTELAIA